MPILLSFFCAVMSLLAAADSGDVTLVFAGDAMQHDRQIAAAKTADGGYDYSACFRNVADYVAAADYAVVNLECALGGKPYKGYPCFSAPDSFPLALKDAGFDLFLHANNHCLDRRDAGLRRTLNLLDSAGIPHVGTYASAAARREDYPLVADVKGMRIAFLNYTYGTNGIAVQGDVVVDYIDRDLMRSDIRRAREKGAELVVACVHWGVEYKLLQNSEQERLADFLVDEGVDLIIGGHPHVVQPMEIRHSDKHGKDVLVVYSLGNFISAMRTTDTRGGAMVRVVLERRDGTPRLKEAGYRLVFVQEPAGEGTNYELVPADKEWLLRDSTKGKFRAFTDNARRVFSGHNVGVPEDDWRWVPVFRFPAIAVDGE